MSMLLVFSIRVHYVTIYSTYQQVQSSRWKSLDSKNARNHLRLYQNFHEKAQPLRLRLHQSKGFRIHECFQIHHILGIRIRKAFTLQGNSDP